MYNSDGSLRVRTRGATGAKGSLDLSWQADSKENANILSNSNSPKASPKAAGMKTKVTSINDMDSPLKPRQRPGSEARARENMSTLSQPTPQMNSRISEAKKKALYDSHIFGASHGTPEAPSGEMSKLKLQEVAGHDIFNLYEEVEEKKRNVLGGVRKDPGGGSTLRMDNLHPMSPASGNDTNSSRSSMRSSTISLR